MAHIEPKRDYPPSPTPPNLPAANPDQSKPLSSNAIAMLVALLMVPATAAVRSGDPAAIAAELGMSDEAFTAAVEELRNAGFVLGHIVEGVDRD